MLQRFLVSKGYEVILAVDGNDTLRKIASEKPAVVLLDITMPEKDGIQVLQELRASGSEVPVMMVTALSDEETGRKTLGGGAFDYIIKPFELDYLEKVLWWKLQMMDDQVVSHSTANTN